MGRASLLPVQEMFVPWNFEATGPPTYLFWGTLGVSNQQPDSGKVPVALSSHAVCITNVDIIRKAILNVQAGVEYDYGIHLLPFTALLGTLIFITFQVFLQTTVVLPQELSFQRLPSTHSSFSSSFPHRWCHSFH